MESKPKIVFVIPLRNRATAKDWTSCVRVCKATIDTVRNQSVTPSNYRIILACREFPEMAVESLEIVRQDFPTPAKAWRANHVDKYAKLRVALLHAARYAPCYVMKLDADDLLHRELVEFIVANDNRNGYYIDKGYIWQSGSKFLKPLDRFHQVCGSSNILYLNSGDFPSNEAGSFSDPLIMRLGHNITVSHFEAEGRPLMPLPFRAAIYRLGHGENITAELSDESAGAANKPNWRFYVGSIVSKLRSLVTRKRITRSLKGEFSIP